MRELAITIISASGVITLYRKCAAKGVSARKEDVKTEGDVLGYHRRARDSTTFIIYFFLFTYLWISFFDETGG